MIPKKIHYCWLSGEDMPEIIQDCIKSWKDVMPDYEFVCWDTDRFDVSSVPFVSEACSVKKWAFAADYIRRHALFSEGGIYLDTDVIIKKRLDEFLAHGFCVSMEYHPEIIEEFNTLSLIDENGVSKEPYTGKPGIGIQAAVLGGIAGHPFPKECMDWYAKKHFILSKGKYNNVVIAPDIYAMVAEKFGFRYKDELQHLDNDMLILPSETFAGNQTYATENSYAIHICVGSWRDEEKDEPKMSLLQRVLQKMNWMSNKILNRNNVCH